MKETFDMIDRSLKKSLQFLRDIQVLSKGFTTIKSPASANCNQSYSPKDAETMKSNMKSCLSFICEKLAPESSIETTTMDSELEMLIIGYHERRSLFIRKTASQLLEDGLMFPSDSIKDEVRLLDCRIDRIRKVEVDSDNRRPLNPENSDPKHAVLRSLGIHAQLLAREAYQAETSKLLESANIDNMSRHALAIAESFSLLLSITSPESLITPTNRKNCAKKRKKCQTSEPADVEQLDESDPDDDLIFEEIVVHDADDDNSRLHPQLHDESNPVAQLGARNVISELKNILPKTVNPDSRRTRKEALFPEYWREKIPKSSDIIIPSLESSDTNEIELTSEDHPSAAKQTSSAVTTPIDDSDDDHTDPDFRSQVEKDMDEGRRDHLSANHDFSFPGNTSLASILAKQVAKKSSKAEAEEFSFGD